MLRHCVRLAAFIGLTSSSWNVQCRPEIAGTHEVKSRRQGSSVVLHTADEFGDYKKDMSGVFLC